jgi:uncharacterized membrane protein (UPF0182 family)
LAEDNGWDDLMEDIKAGAKVIIKREIRKEVEKALPMLKKEAEKALPGVSVPDVPDSVWKKFEEL